MIMGVTLTSSLSVTGGAAQRSPQSLQGGAGALLSTRRTCRSPLPPPPELELSLRIGLVSHFLRVLTERRDPGELGAEPPKAWGGREATEVEMLPSLPATEYDSAA